MQRSKICLWSWWSQFINKSASSSLNNFEVQLKNFRRISEISVTMIFIQTGKSVLEIDKKKLKSSFRMYGILLRLLCYTRQNIWIKTPIWFLNIASVKILDLCSVLYFLYTFYYYFELLIFLVVFLNICNRNHPWEL